MENVRFDRSDMKPWMPRVLVIPAQESAENAQFLKWSAVKVIEVERKSQRIADEAIRRAMGG